MQATAVACNQTHYYIKILSELTELHEYIKSLLFVWVWIIVGCPKGKYEKRPVFVCSNCITLNWLTYRDRYWWLSLKIHKPYNILIVHSIMYPQKNSKYMVSGRFI